MAQISPDPIRSGVHVVNRPMAGHTRTLRGTSSPATVLDLIIVIVSGILLLSQGVPGVGKAL